MGALTHSTVALAVGFLMLFASLPARDIVRRLLSSSFLLGAGQSPANPLHETREGVAERIGIQPLGLPYS